MIRDGGVKVDGQVIQGDEAIIQALLAGGATRGTNEAGQGNGNYRLGKPATPSYTLAGEFKHLDGGSPAAEPEPSNDPAPVQPAPEKNQPTPVSVQLDGNELDKTLNNNGKKIAWAIAAFLLVMLLILE